MERIKSLSILVVKTLFHLILSARNVVLLTSISTITQAVVGSFGAKFVICISIKTKLISSLSLLFALIVDMV
jgi:hypothetical protein